MTDARERAFLLAEIAENELKLAHMDLQDATEAAMSYIIAGELIPADLRFRVSTASKQLEQAKAKAGKAERELEMLRMR